MDLNRIKELVAEELGIDVSEIKVDTSLKNDLNADSLDLFEIIMALEEEFDIEIPTEDVENIDTLTDIKEYLNNRQKDMVDNWGVVIGKGDKMGIDLSKYKVVYGEHVMKAISLQYVDFGKNDNWDKSFKKPEFIEILAINDDGNIVAIRDEAWMFQFVPALS